MLIKISVKEVVERKNKLSICLLTTQNYNFITTYHSKITSFGRCVMQG